MPGGKTMFVIRDKTGGSPMQAELESFGGGPPVIVADSGRRQLEINAKDAAQFYILVSATKSEVDKLIKAGFKMATSQDFEAREG
jgi:hypothetical protein